MKKVVYEPSGSGRYMVLVGRTPVAFVQRIKATRPEGWSAWGSANCNIDKVIHGARTRAVATKAILALLEIDA